jgi:hypothetical protein
MTRPSFDTRTWTVVGALIAVGALQRTWNALHYPALMGFDATGNWEYIELLLENFALPAPDAGWSTAHPPFFYAIAAGLGSLQDHPSVASVARSAALVSSAVGLLAVAATAHLVHGLSGGNRLRTALATALLIFLPVQITMSAMLSEEVLTSALVSFTLVGLVAELRRPPAERRSHLVPLLLGAVAGLALLTKLSAAILVLAGSLTLLLELPRRGPSRAVNAAVAFGMGATLTGGWFYLRSLWLYGYLYPHGLSPHSEMFEMPPGVRGFGDYLSFPLATFSAAQIIDAPLLRSVWGGTYSSLWFDPHRHFLPKQAPGLEAIAQTLLWTALLPTAAFLVGLWRGAVRAWRERSASDRLLVGLVLGMLAGYVLFTARNPWFVTVKGSFLLGLATPFAVYTSETLDRWLRAGRVRGALVATTLLVLFSASAATFVFDGAFPKKEMPGVDWRSVAP